MGIGRLWLCDPDTIVIENLHRQPLYTPEVVGQPKVQVLAQKLQALRPDIVIHPYVRWADAAFLSQVGREADIWIDGTDNLMSRLVIDEVAHALQKPWVYGAIFQWEGQVVLWRELRYRDFFGEGTGGPSCREAGVLGAVPGIIGSWQAALAAMYLATPNLAPVHRLFRIDLLKADVQVLNFQPFHVSGPAGEAPVRRPPLSVHPDWPLEVPFQEALRIHPHWIDIREAPLSLFPYSHEVRPWYGYDQWTGLPEKPIVLVCETGTQSRAVALALRKKLQRSDIMSLRGGVQSLPDHRAEAP
jgi:adenylyltransferase/sulfurtransferase